MEKHERNLRTDFMVILPIIILFMLGLLPSWLMITAATAALSFTMIDSFPPIKKDGLLSHKWTAVSMICVSAIVVTSTYFLALALAD